MHFPQTTPYSSARFKRGGIHVAAFDDEKWPDRGGMENWLKRDV